MCLLPCVCNREAKIDDLMHFSLAKSWGLVSLGGGGELDSLGVGEAPSPHHH